MRQKNSQRQTVTVKTPCPHEPSSLWEILLGWDGSSWDRSLSMNIHVPSDRNLSTTTSLAFGVGWIPTGLFLGPSLLIAVVVVVVIKVRHLVDDEEDLSPVFDHDGILFGCRELLSELGWRLFPASLVEELAKFHSGYKLASEDDRQVWSPCDATSMKVGRIRMGFRWHGDPSHGFLLSENCAGIQ